MFAHFGIVLRELCDFGLYLERREWAAQLMCCIGGKTTFAHQHVSGTGEEAVKRLNQRFYFARNRVQRERRFVIGAALIQAFG